MVGSEKKTVEECCESFENGGLGGVHYSIGDLCFDCLNSLGKTITHSLVFFVPMIISMCEVLFAQCITKSLAIICM